MSQFNEGTADLVHNIEPMFSPRTLKIEEDSDRSNNLDSVMASLLVSSEQEAREIRQDLIQQSVSTATTPLITEAEVHHPLPANTVEAAALVTAARARNSIATAAATTTTAAAAAAGRNSVRGGRVAKRGRPIRPKPVEQSQQQQQQQQIRVGQRGYLGPYNFAEPYPAVKASLNHLNRSSSVEADRIASVYTGPAVTFTGLRSNPGGGYHSFLNVRIIGFCRNVSVPLQVISQKNITLLGLGQPDIDSVAIKAIGGDKYFTGTVRKSLCTTLITFCTEELLSKFDRTQVIGFYYFNNQDIADAMAP